ncbi:MAG TPA: Lrp/AsnC family transcriptional regulator [Terriglobia bacterium]|nr:Lrp/AsnC family transcriptional regulator [Terriglobia bacterium]
MQYLDDIDPFDLRLLAALQENAAATNSDLAERVGLSPSQISRRRQALEQGGLIQGYHAILDREKLGLSILVLIHVSMATHSADNAASFRNLVLERPEILEAYALTGDADYVLKVVVGSLKGLAYLVNDVLLPHEAIARVRSEVVLDTLKQVVSLPLATGKRGK